MELNRTHAAKEPDGDRKASPELESLGTPHKMENKNNMEEHADGGGTRSTRNVWRSEDNGFKECPLAMLRRSPVFHRKEERGTRQVSMVKPSSNKFCL